jgi:hypothetical protein
MVGLLIAAAILVVLVAVSLGIRRHGESDRAQPGWRATDEVFRDPTTDRIMRVWVDPADGSRHYVPEGQRPGP